MDEELKRFWPNNTTYFITGSTFLHFPYFKTFENKQIILNQINKIKVRFNIAEIIFCIAINHYHLKLFLKRGMDLTKVKQIMHGGITFEYKKLFPMKYKEMWQSSRTFQITSEESDWKVTGYIIGNLLKHKEVSNFQELRDNPFSSYNDVAVKYGDDLARELVYKVIDVEEDADGDVDLSALKNIKIIVPSN